MTNGDFHFKTSSLLQSKETKESLNWTFWQVVSAENDGGAGFVPSGESLMTILSTVVYGMTILLIPFLSLLLQLQRPLPTEAP